MEQIYIKVNGKKVFVEVTDEVGQALKKTRQAEWRKDAKERYYRAASIDAMTDGDKRLIYAASDPESIYIAVEEQAERRSKLIVALNALTPKQLRLVKLLKQGKSITEIAVLLGISKSAVSNMRTRIQARIKKFMG